MEKEKLIKKIEIFMNQAYQANCYFSIIKQFNKNRNIYNNEINLSSAFYTYTYNALIVANLMELSKIYDRHKLSSNIKDLICDCQKNIDYFPKSKPTKNLCLDGKNYEFTFPFIHTVKGYELDFFKDDIQKRNIINNDVDIQKYPIHLEITIERLLDLYEWRFQQLEPKINNLLKQRNKVYAHNDEATMKQDLDTIINSVPLNYREIEELITFALDFCQTVLSILTRVLKPSTPINIEDWNNTLYFTRIGEKYKNIEVQQQIDRLSDKD